MRTIKRLLLVCLGLSAGLAASALMSEMLLRITGSFKLIKSELETEGHRWLSEQSKLRWTDDIGLGWEINPDNPGSRNYAGYKVNSIGYFDKERQLYKSTSTYRIIIVGDSITQHGWYVDKLENKLNASVHKGGRKYEVWNMGVAGYSIQQFFSVVKNKALKYDPDLVILSICIDELLEIPVVFKDSDGKIICFENSNGFMEMPINMKLYLSSYLYRALLILAKKIFYEPGYRSKETGETAFSRICELLNKDDVGLMVVIFPFLKSSYNDFETRNYQRLKNIISERGVEFLDLHGIYSDIDDLSWRLDPNDYIHPSEKGHDLIAEHIFNFLKRKLKI